MPALSVTATMMSLDDEIARAELNGLATVFWMRVVALASIALWVGATLPFERSILYIAALTAFALIGLPPYLLARAGFRAKWMMAMFFLVDAAVLTALFIIPSPVLVDGWTPQLNLRLPTFLFLGLYLSVMAVVSLPPSSSGRAPR
ncbi:hypothetical protein [Acuticoccus sediminis]|uniref:hypothetical protein n=1 Tax=Acuticoccus sediminis TaxID=2184697 RepID=UPI001CFC728B|nr:hypothetical protein [Acuticoccus sediminis]